MSRWYYWASAFFLLESIQAFNIIDRLVYGEWLGKPGDKITQSLNLLFIITSLLLFVTGFRRIRSIKTSAVLALGLATFLLCSAVWSIGPQASLRQGILYLFVIVGAIGIVGTLEANAFMDLLALVCCLSAVASLVLLVVSPTYAFGGEIGFRGIFAQKNVLGEAMTIGALASLHGLRVGNRKRLRNVFTLIVVTIVALKSESATSCLTIFAFFGIDAVIALIKKGGASRFVAIGGIVLLLPVVLFAAASPDSMLEMIGKDPTLTGRTDIWGYVIPDIYQRPWLGWGYVAFWSPDNPAAMQIGDSLHWFAPQAHNGILEMLLNVGLTGTALFICFWARNVRLALRSLRTSEKAMAISCLLSCIGIILVGISETVLVDPFEASTSVFFITGFFCERAIRSRRRRLTAASGFQNRPRVGAQVAA
jgi:exopolysaccharide production protein ExoQ